MIVGVLLRLSILSKIGSTNDAFLGSYRNSIEFYFSFYSLSRLWEILRIARFSYRLVLHVLLLLESLEGTMLMS